MKELLLAKMSIRAGLATKSRDLRKLLRVKYVELRHEL